MDLKAWINKNLSEIQETVEYSKYFDTIVLQDEFDGYSLFNPQLGIDLFLRPNHSIRSIHLYSESHGQAEGFKDQLPFNLRFSLSQQETRKILGTPTIKGGGDHGGGMNMFSAFVR